MRQTSRARRLFFQTLGWAVPVVLAVGLYFAYRWAEPAPAAYRPVGADESRVVVRLEDAPLTGYSGGRRVWSLWAGRIDLEHPPGSALSNIQSATLANIRRGELYRLPARLDASPSHPSAVLQPSAPATASSSVAAEPGSQNAAPAEIPAATFQADQGVYAAGSGIALPPDLAILFELEYQFRLQGHVDFRTRQGDRLQAESLTILDMINRRTRKEERRILCEAGAQVSVHGVRIHANQARFNPADRTVECLGGIRGEFKGGVVQAERMFLSLQDQVLRCPETASGVYKGIPATWQGLTLDLKRNRLHADRFSGRLPVESDGVPALLPGR